jgi:aminodeoxyfutalosine deaminase
VTPSLQAFLQALPKAELHVHLVGSATVDVVAELASRHPQFGVPADPAAIEAMYCFTDFEHFLETYLKVNRLVRCGEDVATLVGGIGRNLAAQGVRYAEVTVTPYGNVVHGGIPYPDLVAGLTEGRRTAAAAGVELAWCYDIPGFPDMGDEVAELTCGWAVDEPPDGLVSFGLGGMEVDRRRFADVFDRARAAGLHSVPHAGEADGPESMWAALQSLGAERIGHGIRCLDDPALVDHLGHHQIPLEVCPTSNVCTQVVPDLASHPLPRLLEAGLLVTLNSDDPPMFGTTLLGEYRAVVDTFGFGPAQVAELARNGVRCSFLPEGRKVQLLAEIDRVLAGHAPQ